MVGMDLFTKGEIPSQRDSFSPSNPVKASSDLWYKTKTFHLLFLLTFFCPAILRCKSIKNYFLALLSSASHLSLSHTFLLPAAIILHALPPSHAQIKTMLG
ncbi:hypothetical protein AMECASPLE_033798 [Ameca splendens]|uniref:Uncharacterized protein n=1 Tax=Ameca splendens TaxID=208324 RepID=A0ABV0YHZ6_9TELE